MQKGFLRRTTTLLLLACFMAAITAVAVAAPVDQGAMLKPPATNSAVVATMPGFQDYRYKTFFRDRVVNEGLVIRQSKVENGKIIIPKYGMYYTTRTDPAHMFMGEKTMLLGKMYTVVDTDVRFDVLSDVFFKAKQAIPFGDGSKQLELSTLGNNDNGYEGVKASFRILKASGNYYGTDFPVSADPKMGDITKGVLKNGTGKKTGSYAVGEANWTKEFWDRSANTSGQTYLVVDSTTAEGVKVKEFGTAAVSALYVSDKDPVTLVLAPGETGKVGEYTVKVGSVNKDSAAVELISPAGVVTKKVLGPYNSETGKYLPTDHVARAKMLVRSAASDVQVSLDLFRTPFRDGKVALLGYYDVVRMASGDTWSSDPRFSVRPDT